MRKLVESSLTLSLVSQFGEKRNRVKLLEKGSKGLEYDDVLMCVVNVYL